MKVFGTPYAIALRTAVMATLVSVGAAQTPQPATAPSPTATQDISQPTKDDTTGAYTIRSTVPLVVLDVVVTDAKGNPVRDLQRSDFHVKESQEAQTILNFEEAGSQIPDPKVTIHSTSELDRLAPRAPVQIIVLDEFNTRFEDMAFARYSLQKFLEKQPDKLTTPTSLIAVGIDYFNVLHDYTQSKDEILSSLNHHLVYYPWKLKTDWVNERYATAFITLRRVSQAVMGHPGHKNMIWIGRGFPPFNLASAPLDTENRINSAVQECVNVMRDARITLYTIDPAGVLVDPSKYGPDAEFNDPFGGDYQFDKLARATGGTSLYGRNDVDTEIGTAIQDGASFYTLTYRPTNSSRDPKEFRKISVTTDRPGVKIFAREGYYLQYGPGRVDPKSMSHRLLGDLVAADTSKMVYDGVPVSVAQSEEAPDTMLLHLDGSGLVWSYPSATQPRHTDFILIVSTFDKSGKELTRDGRTFTVNATSDVPATGSLTRDVDIKYHLPQNPKAVRARFTVRVTASGRIGAVDTILNKIDTASNKKASTP